MAAVISSNALLRRSSARLQVVRSAKPVVRAAIYCRISSDPTGRAAGVERQEADCRELCRRRRWPVAEEHVYVDNDLSAYSTKPRPGYRALLAALRAGQVRAVVAWHPDRLHRRLVELEDFIAAVEEAGAEVATVTAGDIDLSTHSGRMVARILGSVAQHEVEQTKARVRRAARERAQKGLPVAGGWRPFGFEDDHLTVREDEADLIREAVARVMAGEGLKTIAADWRRRQVQAVRGRPFSANTLRQVLLSQRIAGRRAHHGEVHPAVWEPIITAEEHAEVTAILNSPARRTNYGPARTRLLTGGLARCGRCGEPLMARRRESGRRTYACPPSTSGRGCGGVSILTNPLDDYVRDVVLEALDGPGLAKALRQKAGAGKETRKLSEGLERLQGRQEKLSHDYAVEGLFTKAEFVRLRGELEDRIAEARRKLVERTERRAVVDLPTGPGLSKWWEDSPLDRRRALLSLVLDRIVVGPRVRFNVHFDAERVDLVWRV